MSTKKRKVVHTDPKECSSDPQWIICKPLVDALMTVAFEGTKLAQLTNYEQGTKLVALAADMLGQVNAIVGRQPKG